MSVDTEGLQKKKKKNTRRIKSSDFCLTMRRCVRLDSNTGLFTVETRGGRQELGAMTHLSQLLEETGEDSNTKDQMQAKSKKKIIIKKYKCE